MEDCHGYDLNNHFCEDKSDLVAAKREPGSSPHHLVERWIKTDILFSMIGQRVVFRRAWKSGWVSLPDSGFYGTEGVCIGSVEGRATVSAVADAL